MIRIATIGTGNITSKFISLAGECPLIQVTAVYSRNRSRAEAFGQKHGIIHCFDNLETLAQDKGIDAVYIASPNSLHYEQSIMMIAAGKHVLCEKAFASNGQEAAKMMRASREKEVVLLEEMRILFDPAYKIIQENLKKLGVIRKVTMEFSQYSSRYDEFRMGKEKNIFSKELSAGALMDIGVYCVHALTGLFGKPHHIIADSVLLRNGCDGAGMILAKYEGMLGELSYSKITNSKNSSQIQGENGTMYISSISDPRKVFIVYQNGITEELEIPFCKDNMKCAIEYFAAAIEEKRDVSKFQQISLDALEIMDKARHQIKLEFPADKNQI